MLPCLVRHSLSARYLYAAQRSNFINCYRANVVSKRFLSSHDKHIYLHIGPAGDCWTGSNLYAAKHLQPDYVKSIPLSDDVSATALLELIEDDSALCQKIYDMELIPEHVLNEAKKARD